MSVYIAFHKKYPLLADDVIYQPLHVGKALSNSELGFIGDDTGDNISKRNQNYSELTGLYWMWKNTHSEIVGLCHYRRFFFSKNPGFKMRIKKLGERLIGQGKKRFGVFYTSNRANTELIIDSKDIRCILSDYDAIIPLGRKIKYSVWEQYKRRHEIQDMETIKRIINEKFPEYNNSFNEVMAKKELFPCNMFIMKRKNFVDYMEWLFAILFELEKRTDLSDYDNYQKRIFGFISERLLDVWITKQKLKYKQLPVLYFKYLKKQTAKNN